MVALSLAVKNQRSTARSQHQHIVAVVVALREADFVEALVAVARGVLRLLPAHARDRAAADVKPVCYGSGSNCAFLHQPLVLPNGLLMAGAMGVTEVGELLLPSCLLRADAKRVEVIARRFSITSNKNLSQLTKKNGCQSCPQLSSRAAHRTMLSRRHSQHHSRSSY